MPVAAAGINRARNYILIRIAFPNAGRLPLIRNSDGMKESEFILSGTQGVLENLLEQGLSEAMRGNVKGAAELYSQLSGFKLDCETDMRRAGTLASLIGRHDDAIGYLKSAVEAKPDNCNGWIGLGDAYCNSGDIEQGIASYERAVCINSDLVIPGLAQAYDLVGKCKQADVELARLAKFRYSRGDDSSVHGPAALLFACLPKSAGTSICRAVEQYSGIPQGGTVAVTDSDYFPNARISADAFNVAINHHVQLHTHLRATPENLSALTKSGVSHVLVHIRDPRQAFVSYYFHSQNAMGLIRNIHANSAYDGLNNQEKFRWFMEFYYPRFIQWILEWIQVEDELSRYPIKLKFTTFEDMLRGGQARLVREICNFFEVAGKDVNTEQRNRLRKGAVDEWRSVIPESYHSSLWKMLPAALADKFGWFP